ncbi:hypothetical protein [Rhizobium sp. P007]|uniref:hypothetical protein n=1 Tax=Rhizobium sp. P007 TaxID=285908 RepID=UPI00115AC78D|nr:hypothetical protein [Rhizobium sp. P007]CAD7057906.1 hypothetical protein RP007_05776 [Rhizobium sp. P007]
MTKLPTTPRQHTPTVDADHNPTTCFVCGMHAFGIGVNANGRDKDPHYICRRCAVGIDNYKKIERLDDYELRALDAGVDAVGEYLDGIGIYDLTLMDELNQRMIVKAAWEGAARGLRAALSEAPF